MAENVTLELSQIDRLKISLKRHTSSFTEKFATVSKESLEQTTYSVTGVLV